jgi:hypothetical protein
MEDGSQASQRLTERTAVCEGNGSVTKVQVIGDRRQSRLVPPQKHGVVSELNGTSSRQFPAVPVSAVDPPVAHGEKLPLVTGEVPSAEASSMTGSRAWAAYGDRPLVT